MSKIEDSSDQIPTEPENPPGDAGRLFDILKGLGRPKVLLVGDLMLDQYVYGDIERISPEAPVMVLNVTRREERPGGAGSVAMDLAALEAEVACLGVVGADDGGDRLCAMLEGTGRIDAGGIIREAGRPTTLKQRIVGMALQRHQQQLLRIDEERREAVDGRTRALLRERFEAKIGWCDVVCLEDYDKGVLQDGFVRELLDIAARHGRKVIIDPAVIRDYRRYGEAWMITPNRRELELATGVPTAGKEGWLEASRTLARECGIDFVVVTLDSQGAFLYDRANDRGRQVPTRPRQVYDVTGAGDMVLAMLAAQVGNRRRGGRGGAAGRRDGAAGRRDGAAGRRVMEPPSELEMVALANVAGGLEVERFGSVGISREEILADLSRQLRSEAHKLRTLASLQPDLERHRRLGQRIVFTNGCFDLLHSGHLDLLRFAREQGDVLIVAINSDRSVRELKGEQRPILNQRERAAILSALEVVDYVIIFDEPTPTRTVEGITPDVLVKGADWTGNVAGQEWVESHGGCVRLMPLARGLSTTGIIEQVLTRYRGLAGATGGPG